MNNKQARNCVDCDYWLLTNNIFTQVNSHCEPKKLSQCSVGNETQITVSEYTASFSFFLPTVEHSSIHLSSFFYLRKPDNAILDGWYGLLRAGCFPWLLWGLD